MFFFRTLLLVTSIAVSVQSPSYETCAAGDTPCIVKVITDYVHSYPQGLPDIGLPPIEPILTHNLTWYGAPNTALNGSISFAQLRLFGTQNGHAINVSGFNADPAGPYMIQFYRPWAAILGIAESKGSFKGLPIDGTGWAVLILDQEYLSISWTGVADNSTGYVYMKPKEVALSFNYSKAYIDFQNFYDEIPEYAAFLNKYINDNQNEFISSVQESFNLQFAIQYTEILQSVFGAMPYGGLVMGVY